MSEELPQADVVADSAAPKHPAWLPFAIDFGPLLAFFLTFRLTKGEGALGSTTGAINGTLVFMLAILIAVAVSQWKLKKISPMLWLSAVLVLGFGGLTIWLNDPVFIQVKPTIIYAGFAILLLGGWWANRPLLKYLLQAAYDGLSEEGWLKLSRNWGLFFAVMALANEGLRHFLDFDAWLTVKVWGVTTVSVLFAMSQLPLMLRHGLDLGDGKAGKES